MPIYFTAMIVLLTKISWRRTAGSFFLLTCFLCASVAGASPYVPLESWIYGALDRLAALGLIPSQTSGLRPWTRAECRRQMREADAGAEHPGYVAVQAGALLASLHRELDRDAESGP